MESKFEALKVWVMSNKIIAAVIGFFLLLIVYKKFFKKTYRRRRRRVIPRSVGVRRRRTYTRGGTAKKAWQIKGSLAARRRMAQIRRKRSRKLL
jgi:hypothetical protein